MGQPQQHSDQDGGMEEMDAHETDRLRPEPSQAPLRSLQSFSSEMLTFSHIRSKTRSSSPLEELQRQSKMAGPLFLQNLLAYSTSVVAVAFIGHLDDPSLLSSAVLANSLFNVSGYSVVQGLSAGMETLCGQAYGGRSYKALGLWLQRALLITWLMCLPISLLWTHAEPLLLAVGQKPSIAAGAARYLWCILPTLFMGAVVECLKRYLLAQQVVLPGMVITMVTSCLCPLYNWLLIFKLQLGLTGAAYAFVLSQATSCLLLICYTAWRDAAMAAAGDPQATWSRPSMAVFAGWGMYLSYGVPACLMICMEWWCYEVLILLAGVTSNAEVAVGVMGLCLQISASAYMASMAYSSSVNTRIGNELGAGNAATARLAFIIGVAAVILVQACMILGLFFGARQVLALLTNNEEVEGLARQVFPILLPTFIGDGVNAVAAATLRGAGRQGLGAAINAVGYWCFGVPLSALFGLKLGMGVRGFWLGLLCTTYSMSAVQLLIIGRFNWPREVERAAALLASHEDEAVDAKAVALGAAAAPAAVAAAGAAGRAARDAADGPDSIREPDVWPRRTGRDSKEGGGRHSRPQQPDSDQERVSLLAGVAGGNNSSDLDVHAGAQQQQQQQRVMQHQASLQRGLLQSCDSIDR